MARPKVSVLIPCYNAERYIGETLESVFRQTWSKIEVIVVDDGSMDRSRDVIGGFACPGLRLIRQGNRGQTAALNECLKHATGDFIQYLDADDLLGHHKIERQVLRLIDHPRSVASAEWARFYNSPYEATFRSEAVWRDLDPLDWLALSRRDGLGMMLPALWLVPMEIVKAAGPWAEELTLNNDAEYFTRVLLAAERVLFCPGARCYYRSGVPSNLSGRKSASAWYSQFRVLELCEARVRQRDDSECVRHGFALSWQHFAHASYPYDPGLAERALGRARALADVTIQPDGGRVFKFTSWLMGWRAARRLQVASGRP